MYFDFCIATAHTASPRLGLDTIFHILGDETYRTPHKAITLGKTYFIFTTQGAGIISYNGHKTEIRAGECMFMQPTQDFSYHCKENLWHFWWFETTSPIAHFAIDHPFSTCVNDFKIELFSQSLIWAKQERWDIAENLFEAACGILHHALLCQTESWNATLFNACQQYILENLDTITVAALCKEFSLQERTLRNLFYSAQGHGPKQSINALRLSTACQLLENTALPLSVIASQLGFSSQFHFSRAFKLHHQMSPLQYRNRHN